MNRMDMDVYEARKHARHCVFVSLRFIHSFCMCSKLVFVGSLSLGEFAASPQCVHWLCAMLRLWLWWCTFMTKCSNALSMVSLCASLVFMYWYCFCFDVIWCMAIAWDWEFVSVARFWQHLPNAAYFGLVGINGVLMISVHRDDFSGFFLKLLIFPPKVPKDSDFELKFHDKHRN